jgi:hypothetical protein
MRTIRAKAFVIPDGTLLPIDRVATDTPYRSGAAPHQTVRYRQTWAADTHLATAPQPHRLPHC